MNALRHILAALLAWALPGVAFGQQAAVQGIVTSTASGGPAEGVTVVLEANGEQLYGAITNRDGFYQIGGITPGTYTLKTLAFGFAPYEQEITLAPGDLQTISFRLEPQAIQLEGISVSPERGSVVRELGIQRITPAEIRMVPVPSGSGDLASYLQTLPGVVATGDRGGQLFVRGGTPAENLALVDGIPIFQPFHIMGFFSVFPEDLVQNVDFIASGFGARYQGRTASVLDVRLRDGNPNQLRVSGSASPFVVEAFADGPASSGITWIAALRRSLIEETTKPILGTRQPLTFESQLLKVTFAGDDDMRCSVLAMRTLDRGRLDPEERESRIEWSNRLAGARCVSLFEQGFLRFVELDFNYSSLDNAAVSRGSSRFRSSIGRIQHDAHVTSMIGSVPIYGGYHLYAELLDHDLSELYGVAGAERALVSMSGYLETALPLGRNVEVRPGVVFAPLPNFGVEPRFRASWQPLGRPSEKFQVAAGLYRQHLTGTSDMRDVSSVFVAWLPAIDDTPLRVVQLSGGWQQSIGSVFNWSVDGYYKRLSAIPVPHWRAVAAFTTRLGLADGEAYGADARIEITGRRFYGFVGYGYGWTRYELEQAEFETWFGEKAQRFHPPHDRRHQVNALATLELAGFELSARWQLGTGLPFTRPIGFDEAIDYRIELYDPHTWLGTARVILGRPFNGRLPDVHRLDVSVQRSFDLPVGELSLQAGAINAYDRQNMFYYDLFSARRVDQLPLAPYAAVTFRGR